MTSSNDASSQLGDDTVRTTPVRNPLDIESLSSWIVNHSSPVLQSLLFGFDGRSTQDGQWLQERLQVKQFGKKYNRIYALLMTMHSSYPETDDNLPIYAISTIIYRLWTIKPNIFAHH
jgi:hypothetical protein